MSTLYICKLLLASYGKLWRAGLILVSVKISVQILGLKMERVGSVRPHYRTYNVLRLDLQWFMVIVLYWPATKKKFF